MTVGTDNDVECQTQDKCMLDPTCPFHGVCEMNRVLVDRTAATMAEATGIAAEQVALTSRGLVPVTVNGTHYRTMLTPEWEAIRQAVLHEMGLSDAQSSNTAPSPASSVTEHPGRAVRSGCFPLVTAVIAALGIGLPGLGLVAVFLASIGLVMMATRQFRGWWLLILALALGSAETWAWVNILTSSGAYPLSA